MQFSPKAFVCGDHFSKDVIICGGNKARLLPIAIPPLPSTSASTINLEETLTMDTDCAHCTVFDKLEKSEISDLKKGMKVLEQQNKDLQRQLEESNAIVNSLKKIFTEGQIRKMLLPDYSATTPVDPRVAAEMMKYLTIEGTFGNSSSRSHIFGWKSEEAIDIARNQIADLVNADPREIVFTSGATEANNLAIKGAASWYQEKGRHIVTCATEHKAVLDTCAQLEHRGFKLTYLMPKPDGTLDLDELSEALREDTIIVSIMHVNNEIGVVQNISTIGEICHDRGILFHVDASQSIAHKIYGPKGIGALYISRKPCVRLEAQIHGGGHENGMRAGTLPVHQIVGMGEAYRIAKEEMNSEMLRLTALRSRLWVGLNSIEQVYLNGSLENGIANILNVSFRYVDGESLMMALKDLAVSTGSACTSGSIEPSYVLRAIGLDDELAHSSIRFSLGRFTIEEEINYAVQLVQKYITRLRGLSPEWTAYKTSVAMQKNN